MKLTPRLGLIADLISPGSRVADIGSDHAHLPIYLVQNNKAVFAVASDINEGPAYHAEENVKNCGLTDRISVRLGGGFDKIAENEVDTAVIAGMGGELIADILKSVPEGITRLILQPMTMIPQCRRGIHAAGFVIEKEYLVKEKNKIYIIISAVKAAEKQEWTEEEYELSPVMERSGIFDEYIKRKINKLSRIKDELVKSGKTDLAKETENILAIFEKQKDI